MTALGFVVRAIPVLAASFPLNDGGLFVRMAETIASAGFSFPATIEYNGQAIPFAYPPLGLYVTAALHQTLGLSFTELAHFLPLVLTGATVPVVALICIELMDTRIAAFAAASVYALVPRAWEWLVGGGGLTRSIGVLFALLAILAAVRAMRDRSSSRSSVVSGALLGVAGLAHPEAAIFGVVSVVFLVAWHGRRSALRPLALTLLVAALVVAPWILLVAANHGLVPFFAALRTGGGLVTAIYDLVALRFTGAPLADVFVVLFGMGFLVSLGRRQFCLPVWAVLLFMVDARAGGQYAMLPVSILAGVAIGELLGLEPTDAGLGGTSISHARRAVVAGVLILGLLGSLSAPLRTGSPLEALSPGDQQAMEWTKTQPVASYAVISAEGWEWDQTSEWFPVLTGSVSVATVQGSEWGSADWSEVVSRHRELQRCAAEDTRCLVLWMARFGVPDYIYVSGRRQTVLAGGRACCAAIMIGMEHDSRFAQVYAHQGVEIFRVNSELSGSARGRVSIRTIAPVARRVA